MDFIWLFQEAQDKPVIIIWIVLALILTTAFVMSNRDHPKNKKGKNENPPK